jgi:hypothetical protein
VIPMKLDHRHGGNFFLCKNEMPDACISSMRTWNLAIESLNIVLNSSPNRGVNGSPGIPR